MFIPVLTKKHPDKLTFFCNGPSVLQRGTDGKPANFLGYSLDVETLSYHLLNSLHYTNIDRKNLEPLMESLLTVITNIRTLKNEQYSKFKVYDTMNIGCVVCEWKNSRDLKVLFINKKLYELGLSPNMIGKNFESVVMLNGWEIVGEFLIQKYSSLELIGRFYSIRNMTFKMTVQWIGADVIFYCYQL